MISNANNSSYNPIRTNNAPEEVRIDIPEEEIEPMSIFGRIWDAYKRIIKDIVDTVQPINPDA